MDLLITPWTFPAAETATPASGRGPRVHLVDMPGHGTAAVGAQIALPSSVESQESEGIVSALAEAHQLVFDGQRTAPVFRRSAVAMHGGCDHQGPKFLADCLPDEVLLVVRQLLSLTDPPAISPEQWTALRERRLAELKAEADTPPALANKVFQEAIHDATHRYARPLGGMISSVGRLDRDELTRLVEAWVRPSAIDIVIVADLARVAVADVCRLVAGYRDRNRRPEPLADPPRGTAGPSETVVPAQLAGEDAYLIAGDFAIDRRDADWPAARMIAQLLGGTVDSVLSEELRGRRSLTYGVESRFVPYTQGGIFYIKLSTARDRVREAQSAIRDTLAAVRMDGFDVGRIISERDRMVDDAPRLYESPLGVAHQYTELISCGLAPTYIDEHMEQVAALEPDRVHDALIRLVDPAEMHVAIVANGLQGA
ncbi:M16 family metallopeptidase [Flexivirga sp. B27]